MIDWDDLADYVSEALDQEEGRDVEILDELVPELAIACENRWLLELILRHCDWRQRRGRNPDA